LALILRLMLLCTVAFIVTLTAPMFSVLGHGFSWRDLILIAGGLFWSGRRPRKFIITSIPIMPPDLFDRGAADGFRSAP